MNNKNLKRKQLLNQFMETVKMKEMELNHPTYHHFVGSGANVSHLDRVLYNLPANAENLETVICCKENPLVESHHDVILSVTSLPFKTKSSNDGFTRSTAPKVLNERHRITWSESGIADYQKLVIQTNTNTDEQTRILIQAPTRRLKSLHPSINTVRRKSTASKPVLV